MAGRRSEGGEGGGKPPTLKVVTPGVSAEDVVRSAGATPPASGPVLDAGRPQGWGRPATAPLAAAAADGPSVPQWEVYFDRNGTLVWLGEIATRARADALITAFPLAMPVVGQDRRFILRGITATGKPVANSEVPFTISGDSPAVIAARAAALPASGTAGDAGGLAAVLERQLAAIQTRSAELDLKLKEERDRLETDRRSFAEQERARIEGRIKEAEAANLQFMERMRAQHAQDLEREQARHDREQQAYERRAREDAQRDRDREAARDKAAAEARSSDQAHRLELEKLRASTSIEGMIPKIIAGGAALGIDVKAALSNLVTGAPDTSSTAVALINLGATALTKVADLVEKKMTLDHGAAAESDDEKPAAERKVPENRRITASDTATGAPASPAATPPPAPAATQAAGVPMAVQRAARKALRELVDTIPGLPEAERQPALMTAIGKEPGILTFCKAVGVRKALIEAGAPEDWATEIANNPLVRSALA